jgi:uncharacterized repeat protein (TIGR03803 family)
MKKIQEPTSGIHWQPLMGLVGAIVVMSVIVLSGQELKHVPLQHSFTGPDGADHEAGLIQGLVGNLYGTTLSGGGSGKGTETVLYSFTEGSRRMAAPRRLTQDAAGNLYGTTPGGGAANDVVVFKVRPSGTETVLHNFSGGGDGAFRDRGSLGCSASNASLHWTTPVMGPVFLGVMFLEGRE